jgi:choline dehydrogenase-like flavoprotein
MKIRDIRTLPAGTIIDTDLALIGSGPSGMTIARELAGSRIDVLILESGGMELDPAIQQLNTVENVGEPALRRNCPPPHRGYTGEYEWLNDIHAFELRNRILGGSSHTWVGKCAAFDAMDLACRPWVPLSGWPITGAELHPYIDRAGYILNLGPNIYDENLRKLLHSPPMDSKFDPCLLRPFFWQFSYSRGAAKQPMRFGSEYGKIDAANIQLLTYATVTEIRTDDAGSRVISLEARSADGGRVSVRPKIVVLCAGGIENARLLLTSDRFNPLGIGNDHDVVGRYLADHPRTVLGYFSDDRAGVIQERFGFYGLTGPEKLHYYLHGLALSPRLQEREGLVNCAAFVAKTHAQDDPWSALRRLAHRSSKSPLRDLKAIAGSPGMLARGAYSRLVRKRGVVHKFDQMRLECMTEQPPNHDSRVSLSATRDRLGVRLARVDWRISAQEITSVARLARAISSEFARTGLPEPKLADWIAQDKPELANFSDMAHPAGTTRMGRSPETSVVDENAKVHGVEGLYVAGSSVFPTPGHANPTLMVVALSVRLADHLKSRLSQ